MFATQELRSGWMLVIDTVPTANCVQRVMWFAAVDVRTTRRQLESFLTDLPKARGVIEVGTHSRWIAELVSQAGHEMIVANPRNFALSLEVSPRNRIHTRPDNKRTRQPPTERRFS